MRNIEPSVEDVNRLLSQTFYKPGWEYEALKDDVGRTFIRILMKDVIDSTVYPIDTTKRTTVIKYAYPPSLEWGAREFYRWFGRQLIDLEIHESKEWFRSFEDGKPFDDPHAHDRRL
jgi:hypothetical protein